MTARRKRPLRVLGVASAAWLGLAAVLGSLSDAGAYWLAWIFAGMLAPELFWLATNAADTLSEQTWALEHASFTHPFDFAEWTPLHWAIAVALWLLFAWLSVHLPFTLLR